MVTDRFTCLASCPQICCVTVWLWVTFVWKPNSGAMAWCGCLCMGVDICIVYMWICSCVWLCVDICRNPYVFVFDCCHRYKKRLSPVVPLFRASGCSLCSSCAVLTDTGSKGDRNSQKTPSCSVICWNLDLLVSGIQSPVLECWLNSQGEKCLISWAQCHLGLIWMTGDEVCSLAMGWKDMWEEGSGNLCSP